MRDLFVYVMVVMGAVALPRAAVGDDANPLEGEPIYTMTEAQLLEAAKQGDANDRMTVCQELAHRGTAASVPTLTAMLDAAEPTLFHAALYALQAIPGPEADAALAAAEGKAADARRAAIAHVRAARAGKVFALERYPGATEALTAFPPQTAAQKGDLSVLPDLIAEALADGHVAQLARFKLIGFPNAEIDGKLLELARGDDPKRVNLAFSVLGDRKARGVLPALVEMAGKAGNERQQSGALNALAQICEAPADLPLLIDLLAKMPELDQARSTLVRVAMRAFETEATAIKVVEAKFGNFEANRVSDVKLMVDSLIQAGSREIMSCTRLAGRGGFPHDPAPGLAKELRIAYTINNGPVFHESVPENAVLTFGERTLQAASAKTLVDAALKAEGALRVALTRVISSLERRGRVPGSDAVLFTPVFNGRDLDGWKQDGDFFRAENGVLIGESTPEKPCRSSQYLVYAKEKLADFDLRGSFRLSPEANSGIQVRSTDSTTTDTGYQADMDGAGNIVGFLYCTGQHLVGERGADVALAAPARKKVDRFADDKEIQTIYRPGEWNDFRIVAQGCVLAVWINGVRTVSVADSREKFLPGTGYISIQLHQGHPMKVEFRDLRVRKGNDVLDAALEETLLGRLAALEAGDAPSFEGAEWIWHPKAQNVAKAKVAFRAELELPAGEIENAGLIFSCDDSAVFTVNGTEVARQTDGKLWYTPTAVLGADRVNLAPGTKNVIEVAAENNGGCAALIAAIEVLYADGRIVRLHTGGRGWKASVDEGKTFDPPSIVGPYGCAPYGTFTK
ncbi:MAG: DUF1080 domain-containing protein [Kiritimatiellae bacterium]|nr:DUF1080 domain-containing protein [Kiritimatiellia bacterium]